MQEESPMKNDQKALNKEIEALKKELEAQKVRNLFLEKEITLLKYPPKDYIFSDTHKPLNRGMYEPIPSSNFPIATWEEDYSPVSAYINQLSIQGITNLKGYFDRHPEKFIELLKKVKVHYLNETVIQIASTKRQVNNLYEMLGADASKNAIEVFNAIRDKKRWFSFEISTISPEGQSQFFIIQFFVVDGHEHDYSRVLVTLTNITERFVAENKLKETNRQLSTLLGNLNGIAYRCKNDKNWTVLFISDAVLDITEYSKEELLHNNKISYAELIHSQDSKYVEETVAQSLQNNQRFTLEYRITTKSGKEKWVWEQGIGLREPNGKVNIIEGYIIDVTDRKKTENALLESEEKFKKAFQSSPTMIMLSKIEDGTIIEANESFSKITGWIKYEYLGKTTVEIKLWANLKDRAEYIRTLQRHGIAENKEYEFLTKSGEVRSALVSGHILKLQEGEFVLGVLTDITEQKQYSVNLDKERTHLRTVLETIPDLVWLKDPNGIFLNCNHQFEKLYGAKEADIVGKTDYDFVNKESANFFQQKDKEAMLANKSTTNQEWVTFASDGHRALMETTKTPMYSSDGKLIGILGTSRDITENKKIEDALRKSENWYKAIFNNTGTATCIIDEEKTLVIVNDKFQELSGFSKTELENKMKWTDFVLPEDMKSMTRYLDTRQQTENNVPKQYEFTFIDRAQTPHTILLRVDTIPGSKMSVASLLDITLRVNAMNQLKESHEKYLNLVENINDIIYELDEKWQFKYISPSVESLTGYLPDSYIGKSFIDVVADEDKERVMARYMDFKKTKTVSPVDFRVNNKFGKLVWVHISGKPIIENGEIIGSRGIGMDISKQKETEAQLILAKEEAEKADRLKSAFLATMSHELRTPLNAIIGFSQIIEASMSKDEILEMTGIINSSGNHLLNIIESMFEIAMLHSKQTHVKINQFELGDLYKNLRSFLRSELRKVNKPLLSSDVEALHLNKNIRLNTDVTKLTQVLSNLLSNAIKYSDKGVIELGYYLNKRDITFFVKDEGIGISKEKQKIIFERFRQVDDSSTRKYGGVGLGLAICKEISELLNGELWVESEPQKGSTFYFKLTNVIDQK